MAKEYLKTWTGADGNDREARIWVDETGEDPRRGGMGDGKPRLCWEIKMTPADTTEEETAILTAMGKGNKVALVAATPRTSSGSHGGSCPFETDEEIARGIQTLMQHLHG